MADAAKMRVRCCRYAADFRHAAAAADVSLRAEQALILSAFEALFIVRCRERVSLRYYIAMLMLRYDVYARHVMPRDMLQARC